MAPAPVEGVEGAEIAEVVECRMQGSVAGSAWFLMALGGFFCLGPWIDWALHRKTDELGVMVGISVVGALFVGMGFLSLRWHRCGRIIADREGLRWRGAGKWRSAYWGEVRDYYELEYSRNGSTIAVETEAGKLLVSLTQWTHGDALQSAVQARALRTRTRSWAKRGARAEDAWPRVFAYNVEKNRRAVWGMSAALGGLVVSPVLMWLTKSTSARFGPGWQWGLAAFGLMELMMLLFVMVYASLVQDPRDAIRRRNERITADAQGLTYEDDLRRVKVAWKDIRSWRAGRRTGRSLSARSLYTIETDTDSFAFTRCLDDSSILSDWISSHLGRKPDLEERDDVLLRATSDVAGRTVYTYRTRDNRALLLLPTFLALTPLIPFVIARILPPEEPATLGTTVFRLLCAGGMWTGALLAWARYRRARIETDAEGITEYRLFGVRRVEWNDIRSYKLVQDGWMGHAEVSGKQEKVRFGLMVAHCEQLKAEISQRAIVSGNQEWNALPPAKG